MKLQPLELRPETIQLIRENLKYKPERVRMAVLPFLKEKRCEQNSTTSTEKMKVKNVISIEEYKAGRKPTAY